MTIEKRHIEKFNELRQFFLQHGHCYVPSTKEYADLFEWTQRVRQSRLRLDEALKKELEGMGFDWLMYGSLDLRWQSRYYELRLFNEKMGHCRVKSHKGENQELGKWVLRQRRAEKTMPAYRKRLLDEIGFSWHADILRIKENKWLEKYELLIQFKKRMGHCRVSAVWEENPELGKWVSHQRNKEKTLPTNRKDLLNKIGFYWLEDMKRHKEQKWQTYYEQLQQFKEEFGHTKVPINYTPNPSLGSWVFRIRKSENKLAPDKKRLLDAIDFAWIGDIKREKEALWKERYEELKDYFKENGHCKFPVRYPPNQELSNWVRMQYTANLQGWLKPERKALLDTLNFHWEGIKSEELQKNWHANYEKLKVFYQQHGHCRVPHNWEGHGKLSSWVYHLRQFKERWSDEQLKLLEVLNFKWKEEIQQKREQASDEHWLSFYHQLVKFKEKHGHLRLTKDTADIHLIRWADYQRRYKETRVSPKRLKLLEDINFVWGVKEFKEEKWTYFYDQLVTFYNRFHHANVPSRWKENPKLANWVQYIKGRKEYLTKEQIAALEQLQLRWQGGIYEEREQRWLNAYHLLVEFKQHHGHLRLTKDTADSQLIKWADAQRYKRNKLVHSRIKLLDNIGFPWDVKQLKEEKWNYLYGELVAFHNKYKHTNVPTVWEENQQLANWVVKLRRKKQQLTKEQLTALAKVQFVWQIELLKLEEQWQDKYEQLVKFRQEHGHTRATGANTSKSLASWIALQRANYRNGKLSAQRIELLQRIDFIWDFKQHEQQRLAEKWQMNFDKLVAFKAKNNHLKIKVKDPLYKWLVYQKSDYSNGKLAVYRHQLLKELGVTFSPKGTLKQIHENNWLIRYEELKAFYQKYGHFHLTNKTLDNWLKHQRVKHRKGQLKKHHQQLLQSLGCPLSGKAYLEEKKEKEWMIKYKELKAFYQKHGHLKIENQAPYTALHKWFSYQRSHYSDGRLKLKRQQLIEQLGHRFVTKVIKSQTGEFAHENKQLT